MNVAVKEAVYIIIPVHNRKNITLKCLEHLDRSGDLQRYHIVVVDDGSTDGTTQAINSSYPDITVLVGDGNLWWTGAIKKGMEYAYKQGAEYFIWLNDDCRFESSTINNLVDFCRKNPQAIIGCQGYEKEQATVLSFGGKIKTWRGYRFVHTSPERITSCDLLSGNLVCIPRLIIDKIGYPNPQKVPHYGGDSLYLIKAKKAKFEIFVDSRNKVFNTVQKESDLYPKNWLLTSGKVTKILQLVFIPQSGLSWRVWLTLNWEAYSFWGLVMFVKKYLSILIITIIRFVLITYKSNFNYE